MSYISEVFKLVRRLCSGESEEMQTLFRTQPLNKQSINFFELTYEFLEALESDLMTAFIAGDWDKVDIAVRGFLMLTAGIEGPNDQNIDALARTGIFDLFDRIFTCCCYETYIYQRRDQERFRNECCKLEQMQRQGRMSKHSWALSRSSSVYASAGALGRRGSLETGTSVSGSARESRRESNSRLWTQFSLRSGRSSNSLDLDDEAEPWQPQCVNEHLRNIWKHKLKDAVCSCVNAFLTGLNDGYVDRII